MEIGNGKWKLETGNGRQTCSYLCYSVTAALVIILCLNYNGELVDDLIVSASSGLMSLANVIQLPPLIVSLVPK